MINKPAVNEIENVPDTEADDNLYDIFIRLLAIHGRKNELKKMLSKSGVKTRNIDDYTAAIYQRIVFEPYDRIEGSLTLSPDINGDGVPDILKKIVIGPPEGHGPAYVLLAIVSSPDLATPSQKPCATWPGFDNARCAGCRG